MNVEFVDELPGKPYEGRRGVYRTRQQSDDLHQHAAILLRNPMRWAKYPREVTNKSAARVSDLIREGGLVAYHPDAGFESCSRRGVCYIRYNPDAANPTQVSYFEGYAHGRKDAMAEVAQAVWDFRQVIAGIEGWNKHGHHLDRVRGGHNQGDGGGA